jgi:hypothetical protein
MFKKIQENEEAEFEDLISLITVHSKKTNNSYFDFETTSINF